MRVCTLFTLAVALASAPFAQPETFVANPDASEARITLKTTHEVVNGTFHIQSGSIVFDPAAGTMSGSIVVVAGSGNTGNGSRDKRMKKDILDVERYATISFAPKSFTGTIAPMGDSTIQAAGTFTLLGADHPITIPVVVHLEGATATAKAHFTLPYIQWGVKDPSFLFWKADKEVAIDLSLAGRLSQ